jgi:hypothetical protein
LEERIRQQAKTDPYFAHNLRMRPRRTLEEFLGVKIVEDISIHVIVENSNTFGLVIPQKTFP